MECHYGEQGIIAKPTARKRRTGWSLSYLRFFAPAHHQGWIEARFVTPPHISLIFSLLIPFPIVKNTRVRLRKRLPGESPNQTRLKTGSISDGAAAGAGQRCQLLLRKSSDTFNCQISSQSSFTFSKQRSVSIDDGRIASFYLLAIKLVAGRDKNGYSYFQTFS